MSDTIKDTRSDTAERLLSRALLSNRMLPNRRASRGARIHLKESECTWEELGEGMHLMKRELRERVHMRERIG